MALTDPELEKKAATTTKPAADGAVSDAATKAPTGLGVGSTPAPDNVGDIASGMMGKDSRLMQKAKAEGMQFANRRGLLNSSIAGQAAQSAMLDQIVPMASQTAQQGHAKNLQSSEQQFQGLEAGKDRDLKMDIVEREESLQRDKMAQEAEQAELERQLKLQLDTMKVEGENRRGAESMLSNAFRDYEEAQRSILNNPELPAEERNKLLQNSKNMLSAKVTYVNELYGTTFQWPENPFEGISNTEDTTVEETEPEESGQTTTSGGSGTTSSTDYPRNFSER